MVVGVTEHGIDDEQSLEEMANTQFFGHAHATMQLHRALTDEDGLFAHQVAYFSSLSNCYTPFDHIYQYCNHHPGCRSPLH